MRIVINFVGVLGCLLAPVAAYSQSAGQGAGSAATVPEPTTSGEAAHMPDWLKLDLQVRGRLESDIGFKTVKGVDDTEYESRLRVGLGFEAAPWLHFYVQAQDAEVAGFNRGTPPASLADTMDFYQGYVELGSIENSPWSARIGRQELNYGEMRLIASSPWSNSERTFDAVRLRYNHPGVHLDWFASALVVQLQPRFDHPQLKNGFYGFYSSFDRLIRKVVVEPYVLWKVQDGVKGELGPAGAESEYTSGIRVAGSLIGRTTFSVEQAFQRGHYAEDRISAWAGHYNVGVPLPVRVWAPRWFLEFNHASGDNAKDGTRGTFDTLYPNNHDKYGLMDRFTWRNLNDATTAAEFKPAKRWTSKVAFHYLWLANKNDAIYTTSGVNVQWKGATSSRLGPELDLQTSYSFNRHLDISGGYGRLWAGEYIRHATSYTASSYPYVMFLYKM
ncbi:exported hypothetical protein [Candidatus Sulfopaludibacter sp. SbA4]|nr:exported hypothetical protein [Candidatus Sulfopaludibacter sp. SbA4]